MKDPLTVLLQAYFLDSNRSHTVSIVVPKVMVGGTSTTSTAMLIHELATNSAKNGALSTEAKRVAIVCQDEENEVKIGWIEAAALQSLHQRGAPVLEVT